ncbi:hypothetical protein [Poseidonocella sp. HB161398]|uniref:hypothetical protein n=1 Tax=Poseidonocella sp. HB161398 TaxID=2320855 RepID=UPI0014860BCF|nr:hypothetical protein [Poseidonocella sp. HB161398]
MNDHPADKMINLRVHVRMASGEIAGHVHDGRRTWVVSSQYSGQPEGAAAG